MPTQFENFRTFYPYYLSEHANRTCRRLHFVGSALVLAILLAVWFGQLPPLGLAAVPLVGYGFAWVGHGQLPPLGLAAVPLVGYGFAWVGHFVFEKNRPATFHYPFYSLAADWVLFKDMLIGKIRF